MRLVISHLTSPIGTMLLVTDELDTLRALEFEDFATRLHRSIRLHYGVCSLEEGAPPASVSSPLASYFDGQVGATDAIRVATGGTAFQREYWAALRRVSAGNTSTYGALATQLGRPNASRAIGAANGANPVSIVVPCHRVIGAGGELTGYGGGLARKRWLLDHESVSLTHP
jgi:methylated-DNA-[protein]-cysteine S-methyltransferase